MAKNKNNSFVLDKASGFFSYLSFRRVREMVEKIIADESSCGIFRDSPEAVVDLAFNNMKGKYFATVWDRITGEIRPAAFDSLEDTFKGFKEDGLTRVGVLIPGMTPFGNCCTTHFISSPKALTVEDLITRFNRLSGINVNEEDCIAGSTLCYSAEGEYRYLFSAVKNDVLRNIEDKIIGPGIFDEDFMAVRVVDRVTALSNYVAGYIANTGGPLAEADVVTCLEQSGDRVTIWNMCKLKNGHYAPLNSVTETIPKGESVDTLSNRFVLFQQHLARERNFPMPKNGVIITDGSKMLTGLFTMTDLMEVCTNCTELNPEEVYPIHEEGAALKGLFEMEKIYIAEKDNITHPYKEAV